MKKLRIFGTLLILFSFIAVAFQNCSGGGTTVVNPLRGEDPPSVAYQAPFEVKAVPNPVNPDPNVFESNACVDRIIVYPKNRANPAGDFYFEPFLFEYDPSGKVIGNLETTEMGAGYLDLLRENPDWELEGSLALTPDCGLPYSASVTNQYGYFEFNFKTSAGRFLPMELEFTGETSIRLVINVQELIDDLVLVQEPRGIMDAYMFRNRF